MNKIKRWYAWKITDMWFRYGWDFFFPCMSQLNHICVCMKRHDHFGDHRCASSTCKDVTWTTAQQDANSTVWPEDEED